MYLYLLARLARQEPKPHLMYFKQWASLTRLIEGALRIGIGKFTSDDDIETAGRYIVDAVSSVRTALEG